MAEAWTGLAGVLLGIVGTLATTAMGNKSAEQIAKQTRAEDRRDRVRQLAAEAYVAAVPAVQWLSISQVADAADPQFADTYVPLTETALTALDAARAAIDEAPALVVARAYPQSQRKRRLLSRSSAMPGDEGSRLDANS